MTAPPPLPKGPKPLIKLQDADTSPIPTKAIVFEIPRDETWFDIPPPANRVALKLGSALLYGSIAFCVVAFIWFMAPSNPGSFWFPSTVAFVCIGLGRLLKTHKMAAVHERGPEIVTFDVVKERVQIYRNRCRIQGREDPGISWARLKLPSEQGVGHFLVSGTAGSGKTLLIDELMFSVLTRMGKGEGKRALLFDFKGDMFEKVKAMAPTVGVYILNPYHPEGVAWDIAADITSDQAALALAAALIPEDRSQNAYFTNAARILVVCVLKSFIRNLPGTWTLRDLVIACENAENLHTVIEHSEEAKRETSAILAESKSIHDVISTISTRITPLRTVAALWEPLRKRGKVQSLRNWRAEESVLILSFVPELKAALQAINETIITLTTLVVLSGPEIPSEKRGETQSWLFLDELREIGFLPTLSGFLNAGRSKGACVCMGIQGIEGMRIVYGKEQADEITGQCKAISILNSSSESAQWGQHIFQNIQFYKKDRGSLHENRAEAPRVSAASLRNIPPPLVSQCVSGYHGIAGIGTFSTQTKLEKILKNKRRPAPTIRKTTNPAEWDGMDPTKPNLPGWSEEERLRFGTKIDKPKEKAPQPDSQNGVKRMPPPLPGADFVFDRQSRPGGGSFQVPS